MDIPALKNAGYIFAYESSARWSDDEKSKDSDQGNTSLSNYCRLGTAFLQNNSGGDFFCGSYDGGSHSSSFGDCWTDRTWTCPPPSGGDCSPPSGGGGGTQPVPDESSAGFLLAATALGIAVMKKLLPDIRLG